MITLFIYLCWCCCCWCLFFLLFITFAACIKCGFFVHFFSLHSRKKPNSIYLCKHHFHRRRRRLFQVIYVIDLIGFFSFFCEMIGFFFQVLFSALK